ncbi:homoserine kinase [Elysia marginata]|uniref:Homoserine kinase n=1 Tax=Elysia marginata TaxID=1093978 RepID=A0AAV4GW95_9GAST|nr:homoserine kinase [Elysia marginata]
MTIRKVSKKHLEITKIIGATLPLEIHKNVAGVAATEMLNKLGEIDFGFEISIEKRIRAGSGVGSSAASSAGAVFGINELLGRPFSKEELIVFAMEGERESSGSPHADNVAPAILGGFTLVRDNAPIDVIKLPTPKDLYATIIHPELEICTKASRSILKNNVPFTTSIRQGANLAAFVSALYTSDYKLMSRSLLDLIVEPERSALIPKFEQVKDMALLSGALGSGISGSGPSIYAISKGEKIAKEVGKKMGEVYSDVGFKFDLYISPICPNGVKVLATSDK